MPHYEPARPAALLAPAPLLLAVSGQMLVAAAATHCENDSGRPDRTGRQSAHTSRNGRPGAWIRRLLATGFLSRADAGAATRGPAHTVPSGTRTGPARPGT